MAVRIFLPDGTCAIRTDNGRVVTKEDFEKMNKPPVVKPTVQKPVKVETKDEDEDE